MKLKNYTISHIELHTNILTGYVKKVWNSFRMFIFHKITKKSSSEWKQFFKTSIKQPDSVLLKAMHGKRQTH